MIRKRLKTLRMHLRAASAVEWATRALFYALLLVCAGLVATRLFQWPVPSPVFVIIPAMTLVAGFLSGWMQRLTLRDCAILVDRKLELDDRVATFLEAKGPFENALAGDTARLLGGKNLSPLRRIRWPRESFLLVLSLPLAAFLWLAPSPGTTEMTDPELRTVAQTERERLLDLAEKAEPGVESELESIAALLSEPGPGKMQEALVRLRALEATLEKKAAAQNLSPAESARLRSLAGLVSAGGAGVARALEKKGLLPAEWEPLSPAIRKRLSESGLAGGRHPSGRPSEMIIREGVAGGASRLLVREKVTKVLDQKSWPPRYDTAIHNYFSDAPRKSVSQRRK